MNSEKQDRYLTPIALVVGAIIIGGALYFGHAGTSITAVKQPTGSQQAPSAQAQQVPSTQTVNAHDVAIAGDPYIGNKNAPAVLIEWFDYQCPFCKLFETNTMPELYTNYVKTGKLKIVFKDFAFLGPDSQTAAMFARAVWATYPDKFYQWYRAMYSAQDGENTGFGDLPSIIKMTKKIPGIDTDKIVTVMNKNKTAFKAQVAADRSEGQKMGVNGTPSMIIGTHLIVGAQPYSVFSPLIDAEINAKK
ncbi:MAG TPA: hypothetical protein ENI56_00885 [Candidatus Kaiserbacteria bacterium]|nr:hypothetical protein [Candidatus Kaiserbacteria bacterium]